MTEAMGALNVLTHQLGLFVIGHWNLFIKSGRTMRWCWTSGSGFKQPRAEKNVLDEVEGLLKHEKFKLSHSKPCEGLGWWIQPG